MSTLLFVVRRNAVGRGGCVATGSCGMGRDRAGASSAHRSASAFRLARPLSKSLPTMLSMLKNTCMTLAKNGQEPCMAQVTFVDSPFGSNVNSTMLLVSNGLTKSRLILTLDGGDVSAISMRPTPALPLLSQE